MQEIKRLLASSRWVTLVGSGGTGTVWLSLQLGAGILEECADGVWFVELAALSDPSLVPQAVASVLGVREQAGRVLLEH